MKPITTYRFRVRDYSVAPWRVAPAKMSLEHVRLVYGDGNYILIDETDAMWAGQRKLAFPFGRRSTQQHAVEERS